MSATEIVKLQLGPPDTIHVVVVVPTGKNEPDAGEHVTVEQPALVVGPE